MIEEALEAARLAAETEQTAFEHSATYRYEKCVLEAIKPFIEHISILDRPERQAVYVVIQKLAQRHDAKRPWGTKWSGYTIVDAVLGSVIAYLTPGFAEAKRYADMYGS